MNLKTGFLLSIASGIMLFLAFPGYNLYLLEWFAFIPLLLALEGRSTREAYLLGSVMGAVAVYGGFYWMSYLAITRLGVGLPFNHLVAVAYALFTGQVFAVFAALFQWCRQRNRISELLLFPVVLVAVFSLFPILFRFKPGDGQSFFLPAIQTIEFTGVHGLDFVLGLVNILGYRLIRPDGGKRFSPFWMVCLLIPLFWFGYGTISLRQWDRRIDDWQTMRIGLVQPNRQVTTGKPQPEKGFSRRYPLDMHLSEQLVDQGAEIVFWPEGHFYGYSFWDEIREAFKDKIQQMGIPLIIFDATYTLKDGQKQYHNSSLHLDRRGELAGIYHKIKLVPFGEYVPVIGHSEWLKKVQGTFLDALTPGERQVTFDEAGMRIVPVLCYEPLFPEFTAKAIGADGKGKLLLVQSQDGWYGKSAQSEQHMAVTALRAVENRVPLVHVINNGSSAVILPSGRYHFKSPAFKRGAWTVELPYSRNSGGSFYSRHPYLFVGFVWAMFLVSMGLRLLKPANNEM